MSLTHYRQKRVFSKTPEPKGKKEKPHPKLRFVVQKHAASHLHYDFRLEMDGVLKSWAVPKGPSMNPADKRLAMMVEDHPFDYRTFEGTIPAGNYGAGTVMVWDEGTYEPSEKNENSDEKNLLQQLYSGNIKFTLFGKKLKGTFDLVKMKNGRQENAWLLIKRADDYATDGDILKKDKSAVTNRSMEQVSQSKKVYQSNRKSASSKKTSSAHSPETKKKSSPVKKNLIPDLSDEDLTYAKPSKILHHVKPMLATLVDEPFDGEDWLFEIKWDGYRAVAELNGDKVDIYSRNNISFSEKFSPVADALREMNLHAVLDGEIVAVSDEGVAQFQLLQQWQKSGEGNLFYYVFDLLWVQGYDITMLPLMKRKEILKKILQPNDVIKISDHIESTGIAFFKSAKEQELEGIIAKKISSRYHVDTRSAEWLKIKAHRSQEAVIAGFTEGRRSRKHFGALILGVYEDNQLVYIGHTGGGFNDASLKVVSEKLQKLITDRCPFDRKPKTNMPAKWVQPRLVCEVSFQEWTSEGQMRMPIFQGLRIDKKPKEVKREKELNVKEKNKETSSPKKNSSKNIREPSARNRKSRAVKSVKPNTSSLLPPENDETAVTIDSRELKFTHLNKYYWKKEKYTKRDLIEYYHRVAPFMMPYMKGRPQSLHRFPNGFGGLSFYQKDVKGKVPDWIESFEEFSESNRKTVEYMVCTNEASLLYMANLGCIEMNPWHSTIDADDYPDYSIIDLDPYEIGFDKVIETAKTVKVVLDELSVDAYCKTSGATGLHIYIPLGAKYDYDQSKNFAQLLVTLVHERIPSFTSLERNPQKRKRKVYLDFLQNRKTQTLAAPYSVRPVAGAQVSTPLEWDELTKNLSPSNFNIKNIFERLEKTGDIFSPVLQKGIDLGKVLQQAEQH